MERVAVVRAVQDVLPLAPAHHLARQRQHLRAGGGGGYLIALGDLQVPSRMSCRSHPHRRGKAGDAYETLAHALKPQTLLPHLHIISSCWTTTLHIAVSRQKPDATMLEEPANPTTSFMPILVRLCRACGFGADCGPDALAC